MKTWVDRLSNEEVETHFYAIANSQFDGHATLFKFTINWRASFGTPFDPVDEFINDACLGASKYDAMRCALADLIEAKKESPSRK